MKFVDSTKKCKYCKDNKIIINYKNVGLLLDYVDFYGRIKKSYYKGTCRRHQAKIALAVKQSRHMALMKFTR